MVHGDKDEEVDLNTTSLISKIHTAPNVTKIIISDPDINTHMGVVRKDGIAANGVNEEIISQILEKL